MAPDFKVMIQESNPSAITKYRVTSVDKFMFNAFGYANAVYDITEYPPLESKL